MKVPQQYILVQLEDSASLDAADIAKEFEQREGVSRALIVRNAADKYESDSYVATYFTTTLALARLNEGIVE